MFLVIIIFMKDLEYENEFKPMIGRHNQIFSVTIHLERLRSSVVTPVWTMILVRIRIFRRSSV